jgi:anti-anti-sigma factor
VRSRLADLELESLDGILIAQVSGEIDSSNAGDLRLALLEGLSNSVAGMVLDLTKATYVDSTGIALCFELARGLEARRQSLRLVVAADGPVRRVLELCAIGTVAPVVEDAAAAVAALRAGGSA